MIASWVKFRLHQSDWNPTGSIVLLTMVKESILHTKNSTQKMISFNLGNGLFKAHLFIGIPYFNVNLSSSRKGGDQKNGRK